MLVLQGVLAVTTYEHPPQVLGGNVTTTFEEEGIELSELYYWCDPCQFVSSVHPRASKNRYNAEMHCLGEKHQATRKSRL